MKPLCLQLPVSPQRRRRLSGYLSLSFVVLFGLSGCETPGRTALLGAATGAAIGGALHGRGSDALAGAAIGAGSGYLVGRAVRHERERAYDDGYEDATNDDRRYYRDRQGDRYFYGRDGRRYYVD